jgi:hypothetical protein
MGPRGEREIPSLGTQTTALVSQALYPCATNIIVAKPTMSQYLIAELSAMQDLGICWTELGERFFKEAAPCLIKNPESYA